MWKQYFTVVGIVPGPVIVQGFGTVDFSNNNLSVETCKKLYEADCRFLQLTEAGKQKLYKVKPKRTVQRKNTRRKPKQVRS